MRERENCYYYESSKSLKRGKIHTIYVLIPRWDGSGKSGMLYCSLNLSKANSSLQRERMQIPRMQTSEVKAATQQTFSASEYLLCARLWEHHEGKTPHCEKQAQRHQ